MKIHTKTVLYTFLLSLLFYSCAKSGDSPAGEASTKKAVPVQTLMLTPRDFVEYGEYYGTIEPKAKVVLTAPGGGTVLAISVTEGASVEAGQSLGAVEPEASLAAFRVAQLNEQISRETYQRQKELLDRGNAAKLAVDQAELAWNAAQLDLINAKEMFEGAECRTPMAGTVLARHMDLYDELQPGAPTFTVADTRHMRIKIGIPESGIAGIVTGSRAEIFLDIYPQRSWEGSLTALDRQVSSVTLTFPGEIEIDNSDGVLTPGLTAKVRLVRRILKNQIVVPAEAVLNDGTESFIMLAGNDNRAVRKTVKSGPSEGGETVIYFNESTVSGEEIILEGNHLVSDGGAIERIPRRG